MVKLWFIVRLQGEMDDREDEYNNYVDYDKELEIQPVVVVIDSGDAVNQAMMNALGLQIEYPS